MKVRFSDITAFVEGLPAKVSFVSDVISDFPAEASFSGDSEKDTVVLPGLIDVHVHLREPGFSYKETMSSGTRAAAKGGFSCVCSMPNLNPVPDSPDNLKKETEIIERDAAVRVIPYGAITVGERGQELSDMRRMAPLVAGFSDDGRGVQDPGIMKEAMNIAKSLGKVIAAHCEDNALLRGGYIHDGEFCRKNGYKGISSESEWRQIERDLALAGETGCAYHVCHISTAESVKLIRDAKADGLDVTCETAPHYLLLDDTFLQDDGRFKMNPPLRSPADRRELLEGICDGTIDMIATDHAPHSADEKGRGLKDSLMGVSGIEISFPLMYTYLVKTGVIGMTKLIQLMHDNPCKRFGIVQDFYRNYTVFDLGSEYVIDPEGFVSNGKSTPFAGWNVSGRCRLTVSQGRAAYTDF